MPLRHELQTIHASNAHSALKADMPVSATHYAPFLLLANGVRARTTGQNPTYSADTILGIGIGVNALVITLCALAELENPSEPAQEPYVILEYGSGAPIAEEPEL